MGKNPKLQDVAFAFCTEGDRKEKFLYIENIDSIAKYDEEKGFYKILQGRDYYKPIYHFTCNKMTKNVRSSMIKDIGTQIKWTIENEIKSINTKYIALKDVLLNKETLQFEEKDEKKKAFHYIDVNSKEMQEEEPERWFQFLDEVLVKRNEEGEFVPDKELQKVFQEIVGYYLFGTTRTHYFVYCVGSGQNGKGVFFDVLKELVGEDFVVSMSIEQVTGQYGPVELIGKKVNICSEEESRYTRVDKLKALTAHDMMTSDRKFQSSVTFKPRTKHIFSSNKRPTFAGGLNKAIMRRLIVVPFKREISEEKRDPNLKEKLIKELPGILAWAREGFERFLKNKRRFSSSEAMKEKMDEFQKNMSSAVQFIKENYEEKEDEFISYKALYQEYDTWINSRNRKIKSYDNFKRDIKRIVDLEPTNGYCNTTQNSNMRGLQLIYKTNDHDPGMPEF